VYLNPVIEYKNITNWITPLINREIKPRQFVRHLGSFLNSSHPVRVKLIEADPEYLEPNDFSIGAEYDPDLDEQCKKQLIINFFINCPKIKPWLITTDIAARFTLELVEALVHEYQHQHQYRSRRYRLHKEHFVSEHEDLEVRSEQEYFGNPDEIDAYGANIAARLFLQERVLNTLVDNETLWCDSSLDLRNYIKAFGAEHSIVQQLLTKIRTNIQYLKDVDDGKIRRKNYTRTRNRRCRV
jgi:hypothetical protein